MLDLSKNCLLEADITEHISISLPTLSPGIYMDHFEETGSLNARFFEELSIGSGYYETYISVSLSILSPGTIMDHFWRPALNARSFEELSIGSGYYGTYISTSLPTLYPGTNMNHFQLAGFLNATFFEKLSIGERILRNRYFYISVNYLPL